jgi:hypothetical protein
VRIRAAIIPLIVPEHRKPQHCGANRVQVNHIIETQRLRLRFGSRQPIEGLFKIHEGPYSKSAVVCVQFHNFAVSNSWPGTVKIASFDRNESRLSIIT